MTGVEFGIAKIFFKDKSERKVGRSFPLTLYIFGAIAFWVTASFLLFFQKGLISYFNLGDHQFIFNAYILSGVLCYAGYLSLNSENYDKENPTIYSRTAMFVYLLVSSIIILSVFIFFGLSLIGFASSAQRAADILDMLIYLCVIIFVIVYGWYLINRFCARYFSMAKILKVNMLVFIIYFIATPAYLYGTKFYTEYKQDNGIYSVEIKDYKYSTKVKSKGKYLPNSIFRHCKDNICRSNLNSISISKIVDTDNSVIVGKGVAFSINRKNKSDYVPKENLSNIDSFLNKIKSDEYKTFKWKNNNDYLFCYKKDKNYLKCSYVKNVKNFDDSFSLEMIVYLYIDLNKLDTKSFEKELFGIVNAYSNKEIFIK
ncbi:hypothetical protein [Francisella sp. XLW-1]|uniref:hypothetical protein n=1 Tax=Francisella sp. XLW-1 TaxID=2610887 RepID=UPI00123E3C05|nr:hypothetical protein [Francisella sp. XLW-1]